MKFTTLLIVVGCIVLGACSTQTYVAPPVQQAQVAQSASVESPQQVIPTPTAVSLAVSTGSEAVNVVCGTKVPYSHKVSVGPLYVTRLELVSSLGQYDHSNVTVACSAGTDKFITRMDDVEAGKTYEFECYWYHPLISFSNYLICDAK
jgi:hypothetical protein